MLDDLNRQLKPHGLWFPVDVSTASRATIGGMTANNSCGGRSLRYGNTRENVHRRSTRCWPTAARRISGRWRRTCPTCRRIRRCARWRAICSRSARARPTRSPRAFPRCSAGSAATTSTRWCRDENDVNLAHILVGSEGTLGFSTAIELKLSPVLGKRAVGACHFGSFHEAMAAAQHIVKLAPIAVELVDATMIGLARDIAMFRPTLEAFVRGEPAALLLVEFAEADWDENERRLQAAARADGRSRLRLEPQRRALGRRGRRARSEAAGARSPSCAPPASTS